MANDLVIAGDKVAILIRTINHGARALETFPAILRQILDDGSWRHFVIKGKEVRHDSFADFLMANPLDGIGAESVEQVENLVRDDQTLHQAVVNELKHQGKRTDLCSNRTEVEVKSRTGETRSYTLDRLQREAPELYAEVLHGNLKANAAAVQAGFRPRQFTVRVSTPQAIAATP